MPRKEYYTPKKHFRHNEKPLCDPLSDSPQVNDIAEVTCLRCLNSFEVMHEGLYERSLRRQRDYYEANKIELRRKAKEKYKYKPSKRKDKRPPVFETVEECDKYYLRMAKCE